MDIEDRCIVERQENGGFFLVRVRDQKRSMESGKQRFHKQLCFSFEKHGKEGAYKLAKEYRDSLLSQKDQKLRKQKGWVRGCFEIEDFENCRLLLNIVVNHNLTISKILLLLAYVDHETRLGAEKALKRKYNSCAKHHAFLFDNKFIERAPNPIEREYRYSITCIGQQVIDDFSQAIGRDQPSNDININTVAKVFQNCQSGSYSRDITLSDVIRLLAMDKGARTANEIIHYINHPTVNIGGLKSSLKKQHRDDFIERVNESGNGIEYALKKKAQRFLSLLRTI